MEENKNTAENKNQEACFDAVRSLLAQQQALIDERNRLEEKIAAFEAAHDMKNGGVAVAKDYAALQQERLAAFERFVRLQGQIDEKLAQMPLPR